MALLLLAAALWLVLHLGVSGTRLREGLAARLGNNGFRGLFSLLSIGSVALREIGWLVPLLAVLAWGAMLPVHPKLFGVSPLPPH